MSADYAKIRDENIARYGWDTAVLDLLGQLYSERTHFIFELIQNAEDAGATALAFDLHTDRLEVRHDGRPFTEADVRGVCGVGKSEKADDLTQIGKFGIGFKSVYAYTKTPRVHSGGESFRIENFVRPHPEPLPRTQGTMDTLFVFPFDHDSVAAGTAVEEISAALSAIAPTTLLFLRSIVSLSVRGVDVAESIIERESAPGPGASRRVTLIRGLSSEGWLVWHRALPSIPAPGLPVTAEAQVEIAFRLDPADPAGDDLIPTKTSPLTVFLPTQKEVFLGFLIQGPYRTTPARDNIGEHDPSNRALAAETAHLLRDVLRELRDAGLLTTSVLTALPIDPERFPPDGIFRPLFDAAKHALSTEQLIPLARGGNGRAARARLAHDPNLLHLLTPDQLGALLGTRQPLFFVDPDLTPELKRYLLDEIGIAGLTPAEVVTHATADFLQAQPDEWITRFYAFVHADPELWREPRQPGELPGQARTCPIIRLEDGSQAAPFGKDGHPAVYLPRPGLATNGFPVVSRAIAENPAARRFLDALGLTVPDLADEVLQIILPRYARLAAAPDFDPGTALDQAQRDADLESIVRALDESPQVKRDHLLGRLEQTPFLVGENAATGEQRLQPPPALYQRNKELELYFDRNPGIWFAGDGYGPWLRQLRQIGVRDTVAVNAKESGPFGHVLIADGFARHERGLDGFDPGAEIEGLGFALSHPSHARSEYVWNTLLASSIRLVTGVVEKSIRDEFVDATRENVPSAIAIAARDHAWLPAPDGTFRRPAELSLDDLPPTYARNEALAGALGMARPVIAEAARQLGIPAEVLWGLSTRPDLVAKLKRELEG